VTKLDRLGRSSRELLELIERIGAADASFTPLGDPLWDTTSSQGRLLSTLLAAIASLAGVDPGAHRRGPQACHDQLGEIWPQAKLTAHQHQEAIARRDAGANSRRDS
jgi:DNA invertase Pin-like site-specific DNA recombinase